MKGEWCRSSQPTDPSLRRPAAEATPRRSCGPADDKGEPQERTWLIEGTKAGLEWARSVGQERVPVSPVGVAAAIAHVREGGSTRDVAKAVRRTVASNRRWRVTASPGSR